MKQLILFLILIFSVSLEAQQIIDLYTSNIPNSKPYPMKEIPTVQEGHISWITNISKPTLTIYLPKEEIATGAAVIICPGGGYAGESYLKEGTLIAETFSRKGIAAFILKYRLPSNLIMVDKTIGPLQDAQQAIKIVRQRAKEWQLDPSKIGIMGFSAGGHLASTAGTHYNISYIPNDENINLRPSFMILVYPVISMQDGLTHEGSRKHLLGDPASKEHRMQFSNELHVTPNTPPTWITHAGDDTVVTVENSIHFYQALIRNKVPVEMHLYPRGNHGFVLDIPADVWMQPLFSWMNESGMVN
ncbi:alpha/beta hydrolase [Flavobacteriaceae bacterium F89]|uniref:Alpha/beta hydrolase n=1 Tax=Cerina litoralis TaxID=2874477 RepID=A0AAE3ETN1_9FLAO|nr:alpha/beta hydrolase [Cerina litoralis]MCG2459382.1 alpha/beta hydrolase [Cerina litoralis]